MSRRRNSHFRKPLLDLLESRMLLDGHGICHVDLPCEVLPPPVCQLDPCSDGDVDRRPAPELLMENGEDLFGNTIETAAVFVLDGLGEAVGEINSPDDRDVFEIEGSAQTGVVEVFPEAEDLQLRIQVLDSDGSVVASSEEFAEPVPPGEMMHPVSIPFEVVPGDVYYIAVESTNGGVGHYSMHAFWNANVDPVAPATDAELGNDIHSGGLDDSATRLFFEEGYVEINSNIDRDADSDAFVFTAPGPHLLLDAFGDVPLRVGVYDAAGELVADGSESVPDNLNNEPVPVFLEAALNPGDDYFILIGSTKGQRGQYFLAAHGLIDIGPPPINPVDPLPPDSVLGDDIHGDTPEQATKLPADAPFTEVFSYIDHDGDKDVFLFHALGDSAFINSYGAVPLSVTVHDTEGQLVADSNDFFPIDELPEDEPVELPPIGFDFSTLPGNDYYITVASTPGSFGDYQLIVEQYPEPPIVINPLPLQPDSERGEDVHADTPDGASELSLNPGAFAEFVSHIDHAGDTDVFEIIGHGNTILFDVQSFDNVELDVEVLNADGNEIEADIRAFGHDGIPTEELPPELEGPEVLVEGSFKTMGGERYYITIHGEAPTTYRVGTFATPDLPVDPLPEPGIQADSELGDDQHADELSEEATKVTFDGGFLRISSHLDSADDRDVFQFKGSGETVFGEVTMLAAGVADVTFEIRDAGQNLLSTAENGGALELVNSQAGATYYVAAVANDGTTGQYVMDLFTEQTLIEPPIVDPDPDPSPDPLPPGEPIAPDETGGEDSKLEPEGPVTPTLDRLPGDINGDGSVQFTDFLILSANYGQHVDDAFADGDLTGDATVDFEDFLILSANYGLTM